MTATTFNALAAARDLEAAGFERRQAEALAEGMRQAVSADRDELATKADLADFATKADLAGVRDELRDDIHRKTETLRSEIRWMLAFQGAFILAIAARLFGIV